MSDLSDIFRPNTGNESSSDGIEFVNSDGEVIEDNEESDLDSDEEDTGTDAYRSPRSEVQIMYIQMEFCEKSTLR